ncbi:MAG: hypothetical protein ACXWPS_18325 [Ktedonobacteraceae bacterium]
MVQNIIKTLLIADDLFSRLLEAISYACNKWSGTLDTTSPFRAD